MLSSLAIRDCNLNLKAQFAIKSVYAEIGNSGLASINFDARFLSKEDGLGGRIGSGVFKEEGFSVFTLPVELDYLLGKDGKNYFELGAGFIYAHLEGDIILETMVPVHRNQLVTQLLVIACSQRKAAFCFAQQLFRFW